MSPEALQFLETNSSAIFGLIGALGGAVLSFAASYLLKGREFNLQLKSKIIEKQIAAHEIVISLAKDMRKMGSIGEVDTAGEVIRFPYLLLSKDNFDQWLGDFSSQIISNSNWLNVKARRECNFVQDYLITLHVYLVDVPTEKYSELGILIREDFINLSGSLEKTAFSFFENGIQNAKLYSLSKWHKYKSEETIKRLNKTVLIKKINTFKASL